MESRQPTSTKKGDDAGPRKRKEEIVNTHTRAATEEGNSLYIYIYMREREREMEREEKKTTKSNNAIRYSEVYCDMEYEYRYGK